MLRLSERCRARAVTDADACCLFVCCDRPHSKVHHLEEDPKKAFASRKAKGRDARRAKKAEDKADQMEARTGGAIRKNKHKNRSKGVY